MKINIKDYISVKSCLGKDFDTIIDTISEASHYIKSLFDVDEINIELSTDPEEGDVGVAVFIGYNKPDVQELLAKFDELWYIDNMNRLKEKVIFFN